MSRSRVLAVAFVVLLGGSLLVRRHLHWREGVANVTLRDAEGGLVTLDELRDSRAYLVLVFLSAADAASERSAGALSEVAERQPGGVSFAGVLLNEGSLRAELHLAFPVYSASSNPDAVPAFIRALGPTPTLIRTGSRGQYAERQPGAGLTGGTVAIFDARRRLVDQAESPEVPRLLAGFGPLSGAPGLR